MSYEPTLHDVLVVQAMLVRSGILPELVRLVLDLAEYWVRSSSAADLHVSVRANWDGQDCYQGSRFLLRSYPIGITAVAEADVHLNQLRYRTAEADCQPIIAPTQRQFFQRMIRNPPTFEHPVRKIVFRIRSHDQGWTTDRQPGPFIAAKSWFDAGIERFDAEHSCKACSQEIKSLEKDPTRRIGETCSDIRTLPVCKLRSIEPVVQQTNGSDPPEFNYRYRDVASEWLIQRNRMAHERWEDYTIIWTHEDWHPPGSLAIQQLLEEGKGRMAGDGQFVRSLKLGDVVTVWARATDRGWRNEVEYVQVDVYWAI